MFLRRRRPRPTADTRVPKGVLGPRRFRHPPSLLWRAPPLGAAPRLPPIPLTAPRGEVTAPPRSLPLPVEPNQLDCSGLRFATVASEGSPGKGAFQAEVTTSAATLAGTTPR